MARAAAVPPERLLVSEARDASAPLCAFRSTELPETPYSHSNTRDEFFAILAAGGLE